MSEIELSPGQAIEYYEDRKLVARINSENIEQLSPITRDYIAFVHPYDTKGMFTIPVIDNNGKDDFRVVGEIVKRERQGNTLVFIVKEKAYNENGKEKIIEKEVRINYIGISLDDMFKQENGEFTKTGWKYILRKKFSFPKPV